MTTEKQPNRYRKEAECAKRCKHFDIRIKELEEKVQEEHKVFVEEMKAVSEKLNKSIQCSKKYQKECQDEIDEAIRKIERSKKEIKRLKRLSVLNIVFVLFCIAVACAGL